MITLFRRIREKLIRSGSVSKYLLYALGEVLLVVLGILIALQVNNWNENRLAEDRRVLLLENIRSDYLSNEERLKEARNDSYEINYRSRRFLELVSFKPESTPFDTLLSYGNGIISITTFSPQNSSYMTAQSTGDIGLITDKELLELFIEFQDASEWLDFHVQLSGDMVYAGSIWDMRKKLGSLSALNYTSDPDPFPADFKMSEQEYRSFFQVEENFAAFESMYWINRNVLRSIDSMLEVNDRILSKIDALLTDS